ncbi:serine--tRNA ligase [Caulobacter sp. NIBR1757]|uniref:serine--tRNA ligase n=1 Tax=Caulobacter sp. NIBR1757 TaxID=3016000 RepID=UPI0022F0FF55|nr:serine--tRNA ligase [Caulobacter sp. NIBR1757]WGM39889.1 Serine--tRNA ligase [Caulobacter sp. NIBR1757]
MHDIRAIRENPAAFVAGWAARSGSTAEARAAAEETVAKVLELDAQLRQATSDLQADQTARNALSKQIGQAKGRKDEAEAQRLLAEVENLKGGEDAARHNAQMADLDLRHLLASLPNIPDAQVPAGEDETGNVEQRRHGDPVRLNNARDHVDLGAALGGMDFEAAARMSGSRFVVIKGQLARLERALGQFMIDVQTTENGYTEISPPLLVRDEAVFGTGQLPKFEEDLFHTTDGRWLIPTAEVSLTNIVREQILAEEELPLRMTALTPSFRSEAGASGRDTRGMIRQHQFYKVELVSITAPEQSEDEHQRMVGCAEGILKKLGLSFRTMLLCTGDMGFTARKTYDLEVWLPSQNTYREISSCSNCGDFQARRMDARTKKAGEKGTRFVHTLNGSGLAVGRTLVAVMENYQDENGRIAIPDVLQPYMGGLKHIEAA